MDKALRYVGIALLLLVGAVSAKTPIGFNKWHISDSTYQVRLGIGDPRNYQKQDKSWAKIKNEFVAEGDSVLKIDEAVLKSRVNKNGESSVTLNWNEQDYVVSQKLLGIGWLKISTRGRQWIDNTMDFSNVSIDSNIITWTGISPGVDYRVRKSNGSVAHGIFFKPAFLDSAVVLYNQRSDSLDIALANVMVYTLSSNVDDANSGMGELSWRQLKSFGKHTFKLTDQRLRYAGYDDEGVQPIPVKQFWRKRNDSIFCIEYVMMSDVKAVHTAKPNVVIWHNDTKKIEGTTNVEDAMIVEGSPNNNYGATTIMRAIWSNDRLALVRAKNLATEIGAGATITDAICSLYCSINSDDGNTAAYQIFKPWVEGDENGVDNDDGDVTYNDWASDANEWTTEGVLCAGDDGSDNSQDNSACNAARRDRKSTAESTVNVTTINTWYGWDISNALAQGWYDETKNEEGIILKGTGVFASNYFNTTEAASNQAFFVFTFTVAAGEAPTGRRRKIIIGDKDTDDPEYARIK
jgi:hypothetical protein